MFTCAMQCLMFSINEFQSLIEQLQIFLETVYRVVVKK